MRRPIDFSAFRGQGAAVENLAVFMEAARSRNEPLEHVLLHGPPGLGKTSIAEIIGAGATGVLRRVAAPAVESVRDMVGLLSSIDAGDVLFIDEIHRLPVAVEEQLYTAMEDFRFDLLFGEGTEARSVSIDLPRFTLIGATTRVGLVAKPLLDRFGIVTRLDYYDVESLSAIIADALSSLGVSADRQAIALLAQGSRGTPRIALRLCRRVADFFPDRLDEQGARHVVDRLGLGANGIDEMDRRYLSYLDQVGVPVGASSLAIALSEGLESIEGVIEPFLLRQGFVARTARGRVLTDAGRAVLSATP